MKFADLKTKTDDQLAEEMASLKKEQFSLRFQAATSQLTNTARVRQVRRTIARIQTLLNERRRASN
ncbi:50S ribosomal protein L29 [Pedomonas sp. V897]|uniref:50S ribosomal protein L29 n=1 Tax=Pedomonas sp. V897 TaxID=3446482 RepID=UPI003EE16DFE